MSKTRRREQDELGMRPHYTTPEEAQNGRPAPMQPARTANARARRASQGTELVPTAILFRMGPPCKYGSAEQPHYKLHFISGSGHRAQGGARRSEGGVCAIIESRRCAAARSVLAFR